MKILIFGSNGLVGSSLNRILKKELNNFEIVGATRNDANLFSYSETKKYIDTIKPDFVINAAAKVGGIVANNSQRTEFILENLKINMNILESLINHRNTKIINLGSSCIYPLKSEIPIKESSIMSGKLEPTNSPYAMAKLVSIEISEAMSIQHGHNITNLMPTNLYGPNDNFHPENSHVIPGIIHRMHQSKINKDKEFIVWGTGVPLREFLFVDDLSSAILFIIKNKISENLLNVGSGVEISIFDLVHVIKKIVGFEGKIVFDKAKPDGNPRKLIDSSKLFSYGWKPNTKLEDGLKKTYKWYLENN